MLKLVYNHKQTKSVHVFVSFEKFIIILFVGISCHTTCNNHGVCDGNGGCICDFNLGFKGIKLSCFFKLKW